jgi:hypothetical protein
MRRTRSPRVVSEDLMFDDDKDDRLYPATPVVKIGWLDYFAVAIIIVAVILLWWLPTLCNIK